MNLTTRHVVKTGWVELPLPNSATEKAQTYGSLVLRLRLTKIGSDDLWLDGSGARVDFVLGGQLHLSPPPMEASEVESSAIRLCFVCASRIDYSEDY